jgi:hypothetical protein
VFEKEQWEEYIYKMHFVDSLHTLLQNSNKFNQIMDKIAQITNGNQSHKTRKKYKCKDRANTDIWIYQR